MSNIKAESPAVKDENVTEQQQHHQEQEINQQAGPPNFGGGPRRGGPNRFGNRRPGPYNRGGGGQFGDRGDFRRRGGGAGGPHGGHHGGPNHNDQGPGGRPQIDKVAEKLANLAGPTFDLPPLEQVEKKFNGRTRLYIGNIGNDVEENELRELFAPYGESSEYFINKEKNFAFVRMDYRSNAEKAKRELDGILFKGKNLKIRFAPGGSTIKVKNLTPFISNELLYAAFQVFGEVERAYIIVDERGKPTGEGIVEFARKGCALHAVRKCSEGCFFLNASLRPCIVESYEPTDDSDGYPEKYIPKKNPEYGKSREVGPRFATPGTFESEYGTRWKQLYELFQQKEAAMKKEFEMEKEKLEAQMEFARYEHETEMLRDQLRAREMDRDRQKHEWEMKERLAEEQRQRNEEQMRRQQEDMQNRIMHQEEEMRRRQQENNLFMQAHQLDNMLEQQEQAYEQPAPMYNNMNEDSEAPVVSDKIEFMKKWEFLYKEKHFLKDYHKQTVQVFTLHYRSNCYYTKTEFNQNEQVQVQHLTENQSQPEDSNDREVVTAQLDSLNQADYTIEPVNEASCVGVDNETCEVLRPSAAIPLLTLLPNESERLTSLKNGITKQWTYSDLSPSVELTSESDFSTKSLDAFTETSETSEQTTSVDTRQATDATSVASEVNETSQDGAFAQIQTPSPDVSSEYGYYTEEWSTKTEHHLYSNQQTNLASQTHYSPSEPVYTTSVSNQINVTSQKWSYETSKPSSNVICLLSSSESDYSTDQYTAKTEPLSCHVQDVNTTTGVNLTNFTSRGRVTSVSNRANATCQQWTYGTTTASSTVSCPLSGSETSYSINQQLSAASEANQTNLTSQTSSAARPVYYLNLPSYVTDLSNKSNTTAQQSTYGPYGTSPLVASGDHTNQPRFSPYDGRQPAYKNIQTRCTRFSDNQSLSYCSRRQHFSKGARRRRSRYSRFSPALMYPERTNQLPGTLRTPVQQFLSQQQPFYPTPNQQSANVLAAPVAVPEYSYTNEPISSNSRIFQEHGASAASISAPVSVSGYVPSSAIKLIYPTSSIPQQSVAASSAFAPVSGFRYLPYTGNVEPVCTTRPMRTNRQAQSGTNDPLVVSHTSPLSKTHHSNRIDPRRSRNRQAQNETNDPLVVTHSSPLSKAHHSNRLEDRQSRNLQAQNETNDPLVVTHSSPRSKTHHSNRLDPRQSRNRQAQNETNDSLVVTHSSPLSKTHHSNRLDPRQSRNLQAQNGTNDPLGMTHSAPLSKADHSNRLDPRQSRNRQAQNETNDPLGMTYSAPLSKAHHSNRLDPQQSRNFSKRESPPRYDRFPRNSMMVASPVPQPEYSFTQSGTFLENLPQNAEDYISNNNFPRSNRNDQNLTSTPQAASSNQPAAPNGSRNLLWTSRDSSSSKSSHSSTHSNSSQNLTLTSQACNSPVGSLTSSSTSSLAQKDSTIQKYEYPLFLYMIDGKYPYVIDHEDYNYWLEVLSNENVELAKVFHSNFQMF